MNIRMSSSIAAPAIILAGMAIAFAAMVIAAGSLADPFGQSVLVTTGSILLGSGLTFFLVRVFQVLPKDR